MCPEERCNEKKDTMHRSTTGTLTSASSSTGCPFYLFMESDQYRQYPSYCKTLPSDRIGFSPTCILSEPALAFAPSVQHTAEHTQWPAEYQRKQVSSFCGISLHLHLLKSRDHWFTFTFQGIRLFWITIFAERGVTLFLSSTNNRCFEQTHGIDSFAALM